MADIAHIDADLVRRLVSNQFPRWAKLPLRAVEPQGHDNRTFRLGDDKSVRLPSAPAYAPHVVVEYRWLSALAPRLPVQIPEPLALGQPDQDFPWHWLINRWLDGNSAEESPIDDLVRFASDLAGLLRALQGVDAACAPEPDADNFFRGAHLSVYDSETINCIGRLEGVIDAKAAAAVWRQAVESEWNGPPVWVHGDIAAPNLLVTNGRLSGVIDFGQLAAGDPACDLAIAWTFLSGKSREVFRDELNLDGATWMRGRGWALWKALLTLDTHRDYGAARAPVKRVIHEILGADD
ncbi:MAG TPA: aminoglycoside phosphotransferase family protein [Gammaproteobacteria bacterium]|nr:aminoglycoside phosphotransferase family protein [Gammaproteobacteria bacterium]